MEKNYTEVIDRTESRLINQDRINRDRQTRERSKRPLPQRAPVKPRSLQ
jgi:hypothetical protein